MKPFKRNIKKALCTLGVNRENAIFMGDQIWTDVLGAHCAGLPVVLVPPIRDKQDIFTKLKRFFEKPFLRKYRKEHPDSYECESWTRWKL
jgi:predicted HAD superfamily phosphohydrolase YqeG